MEGPFLFATETMKTREVEDLIRSLAKDVGAEEALKVGMAEKAKAKILVQRSPDVRMKSMAYAWFQNRTDEEQKGIISTAKAEGARIVAAMRKGKKPPTADQALEISQDTVSNSIIRLGTDAIYSTIGNSDIAKGKESTETCLDHHIAQKILRSLQENGGESKSSSSSKGKAKKRKFECPHEGCAEICLADTARQRDAASKEIVLAQRKERIMQVSIDKGRALTTAEEDAIRYADYPGGVGPNEAEEQSDDEEGEDTRSLPDGEDEGTDDDEDSGSREEEL